MISKNIHAVPLLDIPVSAFFKSLDNNNRCLYDLRVSVLRNEGFFLIRHIGAMHDDRTFHLSGGEVNGNWFLAKVCVPESWASYDFETQIYTRADLSGMRLFPEVLVKFASTEEDLASDIRKFMYAGLTEPDKYLLRTDGSTFSSRGFDVC